MSRVGLGGGGGLVVVGGVEAEAEDNSPEAVRMEIHLRNQILQNRCLYNQEINLRRPKGFIQVLQDIRH